MSSCELGMGEWQPGVEKSNMFVARDVLPFFAPAGAIKFTHFGGSNNEHVYGKSCRISRYKMHCLGLVSYNDGQRNADVCLGFSLNITSFNALKDGWVLFALSCFTWFCDV